MLENKYGLNSNMHAELNQTNALDDTKVKHWWQNSTMLN